RPTRDLTNPAGTPVRHRLGPQTIVIGGPGVVEHGDNGCPGGLEHVNVIRRVLFRATNDQLQRPRIGVVGTIRSRDRASISRSRRGIFNLLTHICHSSDQLAATNPEAGCMENTLPDDWLPWRSEPPLRGRRPTKPDLAEAAAQQMSPEDLLPYP